MKFDLVQRSGAWFYYNDLRIGQGRDNARDFLRDNPELSNQLEQQIREALKKLNSAKTAPINQKDPLEIPIEAAVQVTASSAKAKIDITVED